MSMPVERFERFEQIILCPDCGKGVSNRGACPKCGGRSWMFPVPSDFPKRAREFVGAEIGVDPAVGESVTIQMVATRRTDGSIIYEVQR